MTPVADPMQPNVSVTLPDGISLLRVGQVLRDLLAPHLEPGDLGELTKLIVEARQSQARARNRNA